jgi:hypothetical protein
MTDKRKYDDGEIAVSFINEPVVVEVVPEETAREKANRIWKMERKDDNHRR